MKTEKKRVDTANREATSGYDVCEKSQNLQILSLTTL